MIFKKLTLKNFMSYSEATIDFSGIRTACLSGQNGVGKSSLFDAITWTIWEEGRSRTDDLVKLGTRDMSCELEFYMEDDIYRIYRSRVKGKKSSSQGKSNLEFQIYNSKEDSWISLSRHTVRQTQELINKTLKMDNDTFTNSVYLRQGKADEFTLKKPSERKQVLAEILGLSFYDDLCEKAKLKIKEIEKTISVEESLINELKIKIDKEIEVKEENDKYSTLLQKEEVELKKLQNDFNTKQKELEVKKEKQKQIQMLEKSKANQESLISTISTQMTSNEEKANKCRSLIDNRKEIENSYKNYLKAKSDFDDVEKRRDMYLGLSDKKNKLDIQLKEKLSKAESDIAVLKSKINDRSEIKKELSAKIDAEANFYNNILPKAEKKIEAFKKQREGLSDIEAKGLELKHNKDLLELKIQKLKEEIVDIEEKISSIKDHDHTAPCPLCKNPILDKDKVIQEYENDLSGINSEIKKIKENIVSVEDEVSNKRKEYASVKENLAKSESEITALNSSVELEKAEYKSAKEKIAVVDREISGCEKELESIVSLMKNGELAKSITSEIIDLDKKISELSYDSNSYDSLKDLLKSLEGIDLKYKSLEDATVQIDELTKERNFLKEKFDSGKKEVVSLEELIVKNKSEVSNITELENAYNQASHKVKDQSSIVSDVKDKLVLAKKILSDIKESKSKYKEKKESIGSCMKDKKQYEMLEKAFGKNGIQVAIIETIVPEIEKEANRILSKLTDNRMHVALRTQREKKSGKGMQETLDVIIADSVGTRSYELYSGGEAFKINFALRLAMARLLASRSGAKLQTLSIDEGFGSQDADGRERLVEIIKSIEGEFELILVVTHLDELKDSFSTQIQITKDEDGSKVRMVA